MAVLGILSLFQITLLPGLILLAAAKYRGSLLRRILISFGLSLTTNYVAVFALAAVGLYLRPVVFVIFGAELVAIAWLHAADIKRWFSSPLLPALLAPVKTEIQRLRKVSGPGIAGLVRGIAATAVMLVAFIQIGQVFISFVLNWGTIFMWEDAVFSWNRWALDWFHNSVPAFVYHYPQLVPTNWSISYVFMDMPLQYIAKGMMPIFMLALMLAMLDLAWTRKTAGPYLAPLVAAYLYQGSRIPVTEGGGDLPVSCMVFLSFWCVVAAQRESTDRSRTGYLVIGAVLAAAAAVTKQPGVFFLPIYPALAYAFVLREQSGVGRVRALRRCRCCCSQPRWWTRPSDHGRPRAPPGRSNR